MRVKLCLCLLSFASFVASDNDCGNDIDPADDPRNIIRPCPNYDLDCIRDYVYKNSQCKKANGTVPDPLHYDGYRMFVPTANITLDFNDVNVGGFSTAKIVEFYINEQTSKTVLAVVIQDLSFDSPEVVMSYNRKCKEPIVRRDMVQCLYGPATLTAVFPSICNLDLNRVSVYSYIEDCNPRFVMGSRLFSTSDPTAQASFSKFIFNIPTVISEKFVTQGRYFMISIIENMICDFRSK